MEQQTTEEIDLNEVTPAEPETEGEADDEVQPEGDEGEAGDGDGDDAEGDEDKEDDGGEDEDGEEAEEVEIDFGGTKERFKKGTPIEEVQERIQDYALNLKRDYTQKTQRVAEARKFVEVQEQGLKQLASMGDEYYQAYGTALRLQQEREQLASVDLNQHWATNPDYARRVSDALTQKNIELSRIADRMSQAETQMKQATEAAKAQAMEAGKKAVDALIPGFSEKHADDVVKYVTSQYNLSSEVASSWALSPEVAAMAYKAMLYDKSKATVAKKSPPKPIGKPLSPVRGKGAAPRRLDHLDPKQAEEMSWSDWNKAEEARMARVRRSK